MRIARLILHSIFVSLGVLLIFGQIISDEYINTLTFVIFAYTLGIIIYSMIKELLVYAFPRHIGISIVYIFLLYEWQNMASDTIQYLVLQKYLLFVSVMVVFYHLVLAIINNPYSFQFRKMGTSAFRRFYWPIYLIYAIIIAATFFFFYNLNKNQNIEAWHYSLAILLGLFPHYNKNLVRSLGINLQNSLAKYDFKISFNQLGKLSKIKNFVFQKEKLIESGKFQLTESDYRSTVKVVSMQKLSLQLSKDWNNKYTRLFVNDEFGVDTFKYDIVSKNDNGITVIDNNATMYQFGNYTYVKDKVKRDDKANLFLLRNDLVVAKFTVNERITDENAALINQMDYFGNTILFSFGSKEDLGKDYEIVFDKIYSKLDATKVNNILLELNKRAPTAYFTAIPPKKKMIDQIFHISEVLPSKKNGKLFYCDYKTLENIPKLIKETKKVNLFLRYGQFISLGIQIILLLVAIIFYKNILTILALNLGFAILAELLLKVFYKRLG